MPYLDIVKSSFTIAWRHKYLWLLALFAGEAGGFSFQSSQGSQAGRNRTNTGIVTGAQAATWMNDHIGLIAMAVAIALLLSIAFFVLAAVCEGAVVRGAAEHDAGRPFSLGTAWRAGTSTMWAMIRFRLLVFLWALPAVLVLGGLTALAVWGWAHGSIGTTVLAGVTLAVCAIAAIPYLVVLSILGQLGARSVALELNGATASLNHVWRLFRHRLGRTLLVWLLAIVVSIVAGFAVVIVAIIPVLIVAGLVAVSFAGGLVFGLVVAVVAGLPLIAVLIAVAAYLAAQTSVYWTLAYRRLDVDYAPAFTATRPAPAA